MDSEIRYQMDDSEIADFHSDKGSNWSFDLSEKELERLSTKSPVIKKSKKIDDIDEKTSIRLAEREKKIVSPDGRSHSKYNHVGLNFWRLAFKKDVKFVYKS